MIQVVLKFLKIFCSFGGPYIAPFIIPFTSPVSWTLLVSICLISMLSITFPDPVEKDKTTKMGVVSAIYYVIALIIGCSVMQTICKVRKSVPI